MTFRELFKADKGYNIADEAKKSGIYPCPSKFGYEVKNPTICRRLLDCKSCWEREVPQKEPTKWKIEKVQKATDAATHSEVKCIAENLGAFRKALEIAGFDKGACKLFCNTYLQELLTQNGGQNE